MQIELPNGPPTWPPCVTKRTSSGHVSGESCRPPPLTRQPGSGTAGTQHSDRLALHWPWTWTFVPVMLMVQALLIAATWAVTRMEFSRFVVTQVLHPDVQSGISPVSSPGA